MSTPYLPSFSAAAEGEPPPVEIDAQLFGELTAVLTDPQVSDVLVNGDQVWVDRGTGLEPAPTWVEGGADGLARRLIAAGGRHVDEVTPIADVRLGAVRVHAVLPPVAIDHALVSLRIAHPHRHTLDELQAAGMLDSWQRETLQQAMLTGRSVLISGATGSGKTTLLRALCQALPPTERILTIEDVAELQVPHPHAIALEARQSNIEGAGAIDLSDLVRAALRMRPDRIVVGECRGREVRELFTALNTGHAGGGTIHANAVEDVPVRLEALGLLAGLNEAAVARQASSALHVVAHLQRIGSQRRCVSIARLHAREGTLAIEAMTRPAAAELAA